MTINYRTSGTWGSGKGSNLTATEIDSNFYGLDQRITSLESNPVDPKQISNITVSANQLLIFLDDATQYGPFTLPTASFNYRGTWAASTVYSAGDLFVTTFAQTNDKKLVGTFMVLQAHTSDNTFSASKTISNNPVYLQISTTPYLNGLVQPSYNSTTPAFTFIDYLNDVYLCLEDISPANPTALDTLISNGKVVNISNTANLKFTNLADVAAFDQNDGNKYLRISQSGNNINFDDVYFAELADGPGSLTGNASKVVRVNSGETALEYKTFAFTDLADTQANYTNAGGKYVRVNSGATGLEFVTGPGSTFVSLTDVPQTYSGQGGKYVKVNSSANALEFASGGAGAFTSLSDVPQSYSGSTGKVLAVNSSANGLEFVPATGASGVSSLNYSTTQTPSGVTNAEFLNIPSYVKRINIHFSAMKLSGSAHFVIQFGNASGYITSGYTGVTSYAGSSSGSLGTVTNGFVIYGGLTNTLYGNAILMLCDYASALWCFSSQGAIITGSTYYSQQSAGSKSLGAGYVPTKLRIITSNGTDTLSSGTTINISYE